MSVIIKGMNKPSTCDQCPFFNFEKEVFSALVTSSCDLGTFNFMDIDFEGLYSKLPFSKECHKNCPLVAVPSHGRLIDADVITNYQMIGKVTAADGTDWGKQTYVVLPISSLSEIPTVLEADC